MYARGMTMHDIQSHLEEIYGIEVSPTLISDATEAVMEEVGAWQSRPLDPLYPIVYLERPRARADAGDEVHAR
jgi:putative transposase